MTGDGASISMTSTSTSTSYRRSRRRSFGLESGERWEVACQVTRQVLAWASKQPFRRGKGGDALRWAPLPQCPRQRGEKLLRQARRIVAILPSQVLVKLSNEVTEEEVAAIHTSFTLDGPKCMPYDLIRLLCYELRLHLEVADSVLSTLTLMEEDLLPRVSLVEVAHQAIGGGEAPPTNRCLRVSPLPNSRRCQTAPERGGRAGNGDEGGMSLSSSPSRRVGKASTQRPRHKEEGSQPSGRWPPSLASFSLEGDAFVDAAAKGNVNQVEDSLSLGMVGTEVVHSLLLYTALTAACDFGHVAVVELLIRHGANIHARCLRAGRSPLHYAAESGRHEVCKLLITHGAIRHLLDDNHRRASDLAKSSGIAPRPRLRLIDLLSETPGRVPSIILEQAHDTSLNLSWVEPVHKPHQAPIDMYLVEWRRLASVHSSSDHSSHQNQATTLVQALMSTGRGRGQQPQEEEEEWKSTTTPDTRHTIGGLRFASIYGVRVTAHTAAGYGPVSRIVRLQTLQGPPEAPGVPLLVTSTPTSITLLWAPPPSDNGLPITHYEVQRSLMVEVKKRGDGDGGDSSVQVVQAVQHPWTSEKTSDEATTWVSDSIPPFSHCTFKVRACNALGWGEFSPESALLKADDALHSIETTAFSHHLEWYPHPTAKALAYELQMRTRVIVGAQEAYTTLSAAITEELDEETDVRVGRYLVTGLSPATQYQFRVRSLGMRHGWQHWDEAVVSPPLRTSDWSPDPPCPPKDTGESVGDFSVELVWAPGSSNGQPIVLYEVEAMVDREEGWRVVGTTKETTLVARKLLPGKANKEEGGLVDHSRHWAVTITIGRGGCFLVMDDQIYTFRACAKNSLGWSEFGEPSSAMYINFVPAPGIPEVITSAYGQVELTWKGPNLNLMVDHYEIRMRTGGEPEVMTTTTVPTNRAVFSSLRARTTHYFAVRAMTVLGWSSWSLESEGVTTRRRF